MDTADFSWRMIQGGGGGGGDGGGGGGDNAASGEPAPSTGGDPAAADAAAAAAGMAAGGGIGGPAGAAAAGSVAGALGGGGGDTSGDALSLAAAPGPSTTGAGPGAGVGGGGGPGLADALGINDIAGAAGSLAAAQGVAPGTPSSDPGFASPAAAVAEGFDALAPQNGPAPANNEGAALNSLQAGSLAAIGDLGTQGNAALAAAMGGAPPAAAPAPAPTATGSFDTGQPGVLGPGDPGLPGILGPADLAAIEAQYPSQQPGTAPAPGPPPTPTTTSQPGMVAGQQSIFGPNGPEQNLSDFQTTFGPPSAGTPGIPAPSDTPGLGGNILAGGTGTGGGGVRRLPGGPQTVAGEGGIMLADGTIIPDPLSPAFNDVLAAPH